MTTISESAAPPSAVPAAETDNAEAPLSGRVALVTGGLSGLGAAISERLARDGCEIVVLSLGEPAVAGELRYFAASETQARRRQINEGGTEALVVNGDVASREDLERTLDSVGAVDILVNNAGTNCFHPLVGHDEGLWRRVVDVNLVAPFLAAQVFLPGMLDRGFGRIVSIASTNAHVGTAGYTAYCASKHGLLGLTKALALEIAGTGVTVNTVSPSFVDTAGAHIHIRVHAEAEGVTYEEMLGRVLTELPQGRLIRPAEVAGAVAFLCAPSSESINGTDLAVTGAASL